MGYITQDDGGRIPDFIWEEMKQIIPKPIDNHPLKCHRKRIDDRKAMDGIFYVLRTGCQWQALDNTDIRKTTYQLIIFYSIIPRLTNLLIIIERFINNRCLKKT